MHENKHKKSTSIINHRALSNYHRKAISNMEIFDVTKLDEYPLRLLQIQKTEDEKKKLYFDELKGYELFNQHSKYVVIGDVNRRNINMNFIAEEYESLYSAIEIYIAHALTKRYDPLGYFLVGLERIYELRAYKTLLGKVSPLQVT